MKIPFIFLVVLTVSAVIKGRTNIGTGKTTSTSSTTALSEDAIDGDVNTCFLIEDVQPSKWWRIDLGNNPSYRIYEVKLINTKPTGCNKRQGIVGVGTLTIGSANTDQQCCNECKITSPCIYWVYDFLCVLYKPITLENQATRYLGYNENKPSLMTYNATVRAGNSLEFGVNSACGNPVSLEDTSQEDLVFPCNPTFARYISIEQEKELYPLRFCEIEVYADINVTPGPDVTRYVNVTQAATTIVPGEDSAECGSARSMASLMLFAFILIAMTQNMAQ